MLFDKYKVGLILGLMSSVTLAESPRMDALGVEFSSVELGAHPKMFSSITDIKLCPAVLIEPISPKQTMVGDKVIESSFSDLIKNQKNNLKHVPESEKNLYAHGLQFKKDPYNAEADLKAFIKKLKIEDGFVIKNDSSEKMSFTLKFESKSNPGFFQKQTISVNPSEFYIFDKKDGYIFSSVKLIANSSNQYLNPKFTIDGMLQINIENSHDRNFLHQFHAFDFSSKKFTDEQLNDPLLTEEERQFRRDFNGSCEYMEFMAKQEGTSLDAIYQQRTDLYAKNNIAALLDKDPSLLDSADNKIPLLTHKIWVTSDDAPKNPSPNYIKWLENSIEHNPISEGWTHIFWIENKAKLPNLVKLLENHPNIKLLELDSLDTSTFLTGDLYKKAIKQKKFGKATDIIRLELLRQFGGIYWDTDYEAFQSMKLYAKSYDMIMGLEPMSVYLCNAFMGARPDHPVVTKALQMIDRNLSDNPPDYIKNTTDNGFKTIIETGPALVTAAFALAGGQKDNVDIVLPPQTIYPAAADSYPKKQVVVPNGPIPAQAFGAHYWRTAWMDPAFGSNG